ncbi:MAG TPA: NAD(+) synthase, partial [Chloroflexi bacterium]|nr:NAD(+) synthase [Chloroflexota bacterium]
MGNLAEELKINPRLETDRNVAFLQRQVLRVMRRRGAVVGISGGIDSSVVLALLARAFDVQKIAALILPEKESDPASEDLARAVASHFSVEPIL